MSITKIAPDGALVWQKEWTTASGDSRGGRARRQRLRRRAGPVPGAPANEDLVAVKLAPDGSLIWARTYAAGTLPTRATARSPARTGRCTWPAPSKEASSPRLC
jgi:hypothetical protein